MCAAYVAAYLAQKAQHRAMKEDLANILSRAQSEAEGKKRGETDAVQKDLQRILDQLAETTSLAKRIEADIAHRAWDRQMRVNLKRDLYVRLLEGMGERIRTLQSLARLEVLLKDPWSDRDRREARVIKHREMCNASDDLAKRFQAAAAIACISLPSDTVGLIDSLSSQLDEQSRNATGSAAQQMLAEAAIFQDGFNHMAALAKRDIGDHGA